MKEKIKVPVMNGYVEFTEGRNDDHLVISPVIPKVNKKEIRELSKESGSHAKEKLMHPNLFSIKS